VVISRYPGDAGERDVLDDACLVAAEIGVVTGHIKSERAPARR